jgi:carbonic anhydrase/acetyltransferase-like protein (isoleucine patch superfamily)
LAIRLCPSRSVPPIAATAVLSSDRTPSAAVSEAGSAVLFDDPGGTSRRYPIQMPIYALDDDEPQIDELAYVAPDAVVIGRVTIGPQASVWPCAVLRGDHGTITVGARTSIQDGTVVHTTARWPTAIGDDCVVGHNAHLEGCQIESGCLIGSGSVTLNRAVVSAGSIVAAGTVVPEGFIVPSGSLVAGVPAAIKRSDVDPTWIEFAVKSYIETARHHRNGLRRLS